MVVQYAATGGQIGARTKDGGAADIKRIKTGTKELGELCAGSSAVAHGVIGEGRREQVGHVAGTYGRRLEWGQGAQGQLDLDDLDLLEEAECREARAVEPWRASAKTFTRR